MQIRKWLALLLSAALALSLLAGCGNGESVARSLLNLLDGRYPNISIEIDPELEADLRQAIRKAEAENAGDAAAAIRATLETALGSTITFRYLGDGQKGDTAFDLVFYAGSDPDKAAQAAYSQWNLVFGSLPRDGQYTAQIAMIETENGYAILVKATVDKAASRDDDDDEPEDEKVEGNGFTYNVTQKTITVEPGSGETNGLQELFFDADVGDKVKAARDSGFAGVTIKLAAGETYTVRQTFTTTSFKGILKGKNPDEKATITLTGGKGLFVRIGEDSSGPENNGTVENITFEVQTNISNTYADGPGSCCAGAVAGMNFGNITNCDVTINSGYTIQATTGEPGSANAGGLVGYNHNRGTITDCTVTINGSITDCTVPINGSISATSGAVANAGGIAGDNEGEIKGNSQVTLNGDGSITAKGGTDARAGGLAGLNAGTVTDDWTLQIDLGTIQATVDGSTASVPNNDDDNPNTDTQGSALAGTKIGFDNESDEPGPIGE